MKLKNFFNKRIQNFQALLKKEKIEGCIIDNPIDLFYLTGLRLSLGRLIVTPKEATLFVDGRYFEMCRSLSFLNVQKSALETLKRFLSSFKTLGFDSEFTTVAQYESLKIVTSCDLRKFPSPLKTLRAIKDASELKALKKSADLLWKGFLYIRKSLKEGCSELDLARAFEVYCLKEGASKLAFEPIIAFGKNSAIPHHRAGSRRLKKGDLVLIDIGVVVDYYCSDMTRVLHFGKKNLELIHLEKIVRNAHQAALNLCKPGIKVKELDLAAREEMKKEGLEDLFVHSLGHGVGLEIHEFPRVRKEGDDQDVILAPGMAITIEPGLYISGVGGVRYEDTIIITSKGYINLYD